MARRYSEGVVGNVVPGEPDNVPVEQLLLDPQNARLASGGGTQSQEDLLRVLWTEMAVDEVALSIAYNGYYQQEPLLVIPEDPAVTDAQKRRYVVVEGNRRLAAVRLLRDDNLRQKIRVQLPTLDGEARSRLDRLPVLKYPDRQVVWAYLGFRHINGIKPWDSFSKAKYVASVHEEFQIPLKEIAERIGDQHATVVRLYRGYKVLEQAQQQAGFSEEDRVASRFFFSHLYTALDQHEYQGFLGITPETSLKPNPVPKSKLANLSQLMMWLYGKKSQNIQPLIRTQSPDLNKLREVISKPSSLAALRTGYSLERAHEISIGDERRFREALTAAKEELQQAKATVTTGYSGEEDLYQIAVDIGLIAETILKEMGGKREVAQKQRG